MLVAMAGWRRWVLGAWKIPTDRTDAILPRLMDVPSLFGTPCAIMRDLGPAVTEAAQGLVEALDVSIPILACHYHFLADIGKDLMGEAHDKLRVLFRQSGVRAKLRVLARDLGRCVGTNVEQARDAVLLWQRQGDDDFCIPGGIEGIAIVRALAQWPQNPNSGLRTAPPRGGAGTKSHSSRLRRNRMRNSRRSSQGFCQT